MNFDTNGLKAISDALTVYFLPLAAASALAVALLEAFKKLFSVQGKFHKRAIVLWLSQTADGIPEELRKSASGMLDVLHGKNHYFARDDKRVIKAHLEGKEICYDPRMAYADFISLTTGQKRSNDIGPRAISIHWRTIDRAVYELETARMMSLIQDAADAALNNPSGYQHFFLFLTRGCDSTDVDQWRKYLAGPRLSPSAPTDPATLIERGTQADRYARIRLLMRRQLDGFQTVTTSRWDDLNQMWAVVVGAIVLFIAQAHSVHWSQAAMPGVVVQSLLGGALAPIAKDLITRLSAIKFTK